MYEYQQKINEYDKQIGILNGNINKLEKQKEKIGMKVKSSEENSGIIDDAIKMIKEKIKYLIPNQTLQNEYQDEKDVQLFDTIPQFSQIEYKNDDNNDLCVLNPKSFKGNPLDFTLTNCGKNFVYQPGINSSNCGITLKKGISTGKYKWKIFFSWYHGYMYYGLFCLLFNSTNQFVLQLITRKARRKLLASLSVI